MGKKKDARIAQNQANLEAQQIELKNAVVNSQVQAGGEDQMSPEMQQILTAERNKASTSMGVGINMKGGCQVKKHMKSSGMSMTSKGDPIKKKSKKLDIYKTLGPVNAPINDGNYTLTSSGANFFNKKLEKANPKAYRENYLENEDKKFYQQMKKKQTIK
jgi:murein DD-endopeptidase MepM/ murein hydrolase activator NlpD